MPDPQKLLALVALAEELGVAISIHLVAREISLPIEEPYLTQRQASTLKGLTDTAQTVQKIAGKLGVRPSSWLYTLLRGLCDLGLAERAPGGGYRRKSSPRIP